MFHKRCVMFSAGFGIWLLAQGGWAGSPSDVPALMQDVTQWVALQDALHREQTEWAAQQEIMEQGIALLEREKALLEERIAEAAEWMDEDAGDHIRQEQRRAAREQSFRKAERHLEARQPDLREIRAAFPHAFEGGPGDALMAQYGRWFAAAIEIQRHAASIHHDTRLMETPDGARRLMERLTFGHAQSYAVSPDDRMAAHGVWTGSEWQWTWNAVWAPAVRDAIRIHLGERAPGWVLLPVEIVEETP